LLYLIIKFFSPLPLSNGSVWIPEKKLMEIQRTFPQYSDYIREPIEGCIGFLKGKDYRAQNCCELEILKISTNEGSMTIDFKIKQELNLKNGEIDKSLYALARRADWVDDENPFYPDVCFLDKNSFDTVRKGRQRPYRAASRNAELDRLQQARDWKAITDKFEPLDSIEQREVWYNTDTLYTIGLACSKRGELQNGRGHDQEHLNEIRRYRELSIKIFRRCYELDPLSFHYPSALAYRHYLNVIELDQHRGRRDGNIKEEISDALYWFDEALKLYPGSIKDNYRKGRLLHKYVIQRLQFDGKPWDTEKRKTIKEARKTAESCLRTAIERYKESPKPYYRRNYAGSLYTLGQLYDDQVAVQWVELAWHRLIGIDYDYELNNQSLNLLTAALGTFHECFEAELDDDVEPHTELRQLIRISKKWHISLSDKLYRLGLTNLKLYFLKVLSQDNQSAFQANGESAEKYLKLAIQVAQQTGDRRAYWYTADKLAWCCILSGKYQEAVQLTHSASDGYILNTCAIALLFIGTQDANQQAIQVLQRAIKARNHNTLHISQGLLALTYKLSGMDTEYRSLIAELGGNIPRTTKRLLSLLR
jgi:hypothetical protein